MTDAVRDAYDAWATRYDTDANATRDLDAQVLRAAGLPVAGARIVEFGAGTGKNTAWLAPQAAAVVALDLSPAMLAVARRRVDAGHVRFVEHDITRPWPVPPGAADLVVGNLVLEHVADLEPVFAAARAALVAGGLCYVCELHPFRQLGGSVARFTTATGERRIPAHLHLASDYVTAALAAGLRLVRMAEPGDAHGGPPRLLQLVFAASEASGR